MAHGWAFLQWISPRLSPFLPPKQHVNKQCSSKFAWAGWSMLGTIWLSQTQLCLDTTTLICRPALKVVQWPPFPFLPFFFLQLRSSEPERERERERIDLVPFLLCFHCALPGPSSPFLLPSFSGSGICWPWPLGGLSSECGKSQSQSTSGFILVTKEVSF